MSYAGTGCSSFNDSGLEEEQAEFEEIAANLLWNWTNRIFGVITETIRPCRVVTPWRPSTFEGLGPEAAYWELGSVKGYGYLPVFAEGDWLVLRCGLCGSQACGCDSSRAIHLPGPVQSIEEIVIGGIELSPSAYRVDNARTLIRQDGGVWPRTQDLIAPLGELDTWSITFTRGVPVPKGGQIAAGLLACELYKGAIGDQSCGLPSRVQSITRQGVSVELVQTTFAEAQDGRTGIFAIDSWIASVTKPRDYAGVASPDTGKRPAWNLGYGR